MANTKRTRPEPGFYRRLHNFSSADDLESPTSSRPRELTTTRCLKPIHEELPEGVYKVERIVTDHIKNVRHIITLYGGIVHAMLYYIIYIQGTHKFLILWEGYSIEEASWVSEEDITAVTIQ